MAPRTEFKKLPRGWRYVLSRREVRDLAEQIGEELVYVRFDGTHADRSKNPGLFGAGVLEARRRDAVWYFRLTLEGLRESVLATLASDSPNPRDAILDFVAQRRAEISDPRAASQELRLYYWQRQDELRLEPSECETDYLGRLLDRPDSWLPASASGV